MLLHSYCVIGQALLCGRVLVSYYYYYRYNYCVVIIINIIPKFNLTLMWTQWTCADVIWAVRFFPCGSAGGPDKLRPQHLKDLPQQVGDKELESPPLTALADFCSLVLSGKVTRALFFFGGSLVVLRKKKGALSPITVGCTLKYLVATRSTPLWSWILQMPLLGETAFCQLSNYCVPSLPIHPFSVCIIRLGWQVNNISWESAAGGPTRPPAFLSSFTSTGSALAIEFPIIILGWCHIGRELWRPHPWHSSNKRCWKSRAVGEHCSVKYWAMTWQYVAPCLLNSQAHSWWVFLRHICWAPL